MARVLKKFKLRLKFSENSQDYARAFQKFFKSGSSFFEISKEWKMCKIKRKTIIRGSFFPYISLFVIIPSIICWMSCVQWVKYFSCLFVGIHFNLFLSSGHCWIDCLIKLWFSRHLDWRLFLNQILIQSQQLKNLIFHIGRP